MLGRVRKMFRRAPEQRAAGFCAPAGWFSGSAAINAQVAENLSTVTACINAIASGLANLPAYIYRDQDDGRVEAPDHPVSRTLRRPNARQTWPDFIETMVGQVLMHGNALAAIEADGSLVPIPCPYVSVQLLPSGRMAFDVVAMSGPFGGVGTPRRYLDSEVVHLKDRSDDGLLGRSRISRAPDPLASAIGLQNYSTAIWDNAATPSGVFELPQNISVEGKQRLDVHFAERHAGAGNGKRVLFVDAGTKFTPMAVSPEDAEVLASRRFSVEEICRLFNVPPPIVQDYTHNTFTNASQAAIWFATNTLAPWARKIEAEFGRQLLAPPYSLELDLSGLMRGDYATRWQANVAAVSAGILTPNEVREAEGYNPLPPALPAGAPDPVVPGEGDA